MGKEAKIGLAVILILLIALGVVVVRRLSGSREEPQVSSLEPKGEEGDKVQEHSRRRETDASSHAAKPALLAPKTPSSQSPKTSPGDLGQWSVVSDADDARRVAGGGYSKTSPPSYMPRPPQAQAADPYDRYGSAYAPSAAQQARPDDRGGASSPLDGGLSRDPFPHRSSQTPSAGGEQGGPSRYASRSADLPADTPQASGGAGRGYTGSGGQWPSGQYAGQTANSQQAPAYGQSSRYGFTTPPQPPEPARTYSSGDHRAAADSRYGSGSAGSSYSSSHSGSQYVADRSGSRPGTGAGYSRTGRGFRREDGTYEIQPNDSFWIISEKLYGTGAYFKALAEHNRKKISQEDQLPVGEVIAAPDTAQLEKAYPDLCPKPGHREADKQRATTIGTLGQYAAGRTYVVQEGDTLFDIARNELGKASRWAEIYELNRDQLGPDYNYLPRGLQILLPGNDAAGSTTRRLSPNPPYHR